LLSATLALAQSQAPPRPSSPDVPFVGNWNPPAAFTTDWWNDPEIANELRLTEAQKKQLEQVSTNLKLTLIDAGASGLKSYVRLQSLLDTDPFDRPAFNQELDSASAAASRLVKDFGQMAVSVRTTLTAEQWHKLEAMKAAGRMRLHPETHEGPRNRRSNPPPSLQNPQ
jgi:Spy/CpxP family protein refolding chaperone